MQHIINKYLAVVLSSSPLVYLQMSLVSVVVKGLQWFESNFDDILVLRGQDDLLVFLLIHLVKQSAATNVFLQLWMWVVVESLTVFEVDKTVYFSNIPVLIVIM